MDRQQLWDQRDCGDEPSRGATEPEHCDDGTGAPRPGARRRVLWAGMALLALSFCHCGDDIDVEAICAQPPDCVVDTASEEECVASFEEEEEHAEEEGCEDSYEECVECQDERGTCEDRKAAEAANEKPPCGDECMRYMECAHPEALSGSAYGGGCGTIRM